jgi:hypothetical protein
MEIIIEFVNGKMVVAFDGTAPLAKNIFQAMTKELTDYPSVTMTLGIAAVSLVYDGSTIDYWNP